MRLRAVIPLFVVLLMVAASPGVPRRKSRNPGLSTPAVAAMGEGKTLFEQKCSVCHGLDRATARTETKERWSEIIKEMQGKRADWITDDEAAKILDYLSSSYGK